MESLEHDIVGAENRKSPYTNKNPGGQMPALQLDNGSVLAETVVICEFLEEIHPIPALIGTTAQERAETRMWTRRIEQKITENMYNGYRYSEGLERFKDRMRCLPEAADGLKAIAQDGLVWLDALMEGRDTCVVIVSLSQTLYSTAAQTLLLLSARVWILVWEISARGSPGWMRVQVLLLVCTQSQ